MLETSFDNGDLELTLDCDICGNSDTFYGENFADAWNQGKAKGWKAKRNGAEWEHSCPDCEFDSNW